MESSKIRPEEYKDWDPLPDYYLIAEEVVAGIMTDPLDGDIIPRIKTECRRLNEDCDWAVLAFGFVDVLLDDQLGKLNEDTSSELIAQLKHQKSWLHDFAREYVYQHFRLQMKKTGTIETLDEIEGYLNLRDLDIFFRAGLEWAKEYVEKEYEREVKRKEREKALAEFNDPDQGKPGATRQLAMMLLDELFPNFKRASNKAKAEFLSLFTGWSSEGLRQKWVDYEHGNPKTIARDKRTVAEWKNKLGIED